MHRIRMKSRAIGLAASALLLATATGMAETPKLDPQKFAVQRTIIEQELKEGGSYAEIDSASRTEVLAALKRISTVFDGNDNASSLTDADQVQIFNDQELINSILTRAAKDSRVVCSREARRQSHITDTKCMTLAERRRQAEGAEETVRILQSKGAPNAISDHH